MSNTTHVDSIKLERFLAAIYVDPAARARFLASPEVEASRAGLSEQQCLRLRELDFTGLGLASDSFARKRAAKEAKWASLDSGWWRRILRSLSRQEWLSHIFRLCAMNPESRKDRRR